MMSTSAHNAADEWEMHRRTLYRLFIAERKSCKEIAEYMRDHYQFHKKPKDYEYRLKKWHYRPNAKEAEWKLVGKEIDKRTLLGKRSEVLISGRRELPERVRRRTMFHRSRPKLGSESSPVLETLDSNSGLMSINVQTPPFVVCESSWPDELPWLKFNKRFGDLLVAQAHRDTTRNFVAGNFEFLGASMVQSSTYFRKTSVQKNLPGKWFSSYLNMISPEIYDGDHMSSVNTMLIGPRESAKVELLRLAIYLLSNNMKLGPTEMEPLDFLEKYGLLTKSNIHWLMSTRDETSEALADALVRESLSRDDSSTLSWLIDEGIDVERTISTFVSDHGFRNLTLLQAAVDEGSIRCCEVLLDAGADPNRRSYENTLFPVEYAGYYSRGDKSTEMVKLLLSKGADITEAIKTKLLFHAIKFHGLSLALLMLQNGAMISRGMLVSAARAPGCDKYAEILQLLYTRYPNVLIHLNINFFTDRDALPPIALERAIRHDLFNGPFGETEFLLRIGADPNGVRHFFTPIEYVCDEGIREESMVKMITLLVEFGGRVNRYESTTPSALQLAAYRGMSSVVQMLLDVGADVNAYFPGEGLRWKGYASTALFTALQRSHSEVVNVIWRYKPRLLGHELDYAIGYRNTELIPRLLQEGVMITKRTSSLELALVLRDFEVISLELQDAAYDSLSLYEATSLALKEARYLFVVEKLIDKRLTIGRDDLEVAALAIAVMNGHSELYNFLSNPKFLPGSWMVTLRPNIGTIPKRDKYSFGKPRIKLNSDNIFEIYPWTLRSIELWYLDKRECRIHVLELAAWFESDFARDYAIKDLLKLKPFSGHLNVYRLVFSDTLSNAPLTRIIEACREAGTYLSTTRNRFSSLEIAIVLRPELVKTLLDAGYYANARPILHPPWNTAEYGESMTPLQRATQELSVDIMTLLIEAGADVNAPAGCASGATCLQLVAINGSIGIARMLLERGANVNARRARFEGRTAIEGAAENGRLDMTKFLLLYQGENTFQQHRIQFIRGVKFATEGGYHTIANMLKRHMQWNGHDQVIYDEIDIQKWDILDEMTQELSAYELKKLGIRCSTDEVVYDDVFYGSYNESDTSSDDSEVSDVANEFREEEAEDMASISSNDLSETESRREELGFISAASIDVLMDDFLPLHSPADRDPEDIFGDDIDLSDINEHSFEGTMIEEIHRQNQGDLPIYSIGHFSDNALERLDWKTFLSADVDDVVEELGEMS